MEWAGGPIDGAVQVAPTPKQKDTSLYHCSFCPLTPLECDQCAAADASLSLVALGTNQSLGRTTAAAPLLFTRVGSLEGLPYSNILSLALSPSPTSWPKAWVQPRSPFSLP